ncbi:hypothetical protein [Polyangium jinanense]|uniref:Uncharacterized protein n=1 Tax=Polyangium jinanense TaxID=2829994 RepID=A0A9X4APT0_9BACT|nr:hypothetical protein [Polyangium jinanense]MDC3952755.1 hypothetical protein [Polyangium jinanense]MDC3980374.1 hypothetical protein [Polyangium jinanense]
MDRAIRSKLLAGLVATFAAYSTIPGCVIRFGPISEEEQTTDDGRTDTPDQPDEPQPTPEEEADPFEGIDPQELALVQAKSSLTTAYLVAQAESSGIDPSTLDADALGQLMAQYLPAASASADAWLATLDPATLPLYTAPYSEACEFDFNCKSNIRCEYNAPAVNHRCTVTDCGKSRCSICPDWVADLLKSLVLTTWCAYVCQETGLAPRKVVAIGAGGISAFKGYFVGPICKEP